jgi:hypothetical protein
MRKLSHWALAAVAAVGMTASVSGVSVAAPPDHCVLNVETNDMRCYDTFAEAQQRTSSAQVVLGTWFDLTNHHPRGATLRFAGSSACTPTTSDTDYQDPDLRGSGWDNRVSSLTTANLCDFKLYDLPGFRGTATGWLNNPSGLGAMNNRASSYKIS